MPDFGLAAGAFLPAFCLPVFACNRAARIRLLAKKIRKKYSDFGFFCILDMCR